MDEVFRCPACGSMDVALPDNPKQVGGAACETCGHRGRRKDFRIGRGLKDPISPADEEQVRSFLDRFKVRP